jgi:hypothetical protein
VGILNSSSSEVRNRTALLLYIWFCNGIDWQKTKQTMALLTDRNYKPSSEYAQASSETCGLLCYPVAAAFVIGLNGGGIILMGVGGAQNNAVMWGIGIAWTLIVLGYWYGEIMLEAVQWIFGKCAKHTNASQKPVSRENTAKKQLKEPEEEKGSMRPKPANQDMDNPEDAKNPSPQSPNAGASRKIVRLADMKILPPKKARADAQTEIAARMHQMVVDTFSFFSPKSSVHAMQGYANV